MTALTELKTIARAVAPSPVRSAWGRFYGDVKLRRARAAFERAGSGPPFLPIDTLPELMRRGYRPPDPVRYDAEGLVLRARDKRRQLAARVPLAECRVCVELGCWDGMALAALAGPGRLAVGADLSTSGFDRRAAAAGVRLVQSDAGRLPIAAGSVHLVYSFAAFEHFRDPRAVMAESWRVLRPGGYLFLMFGPVYTSPYGLHAYRQIPVPYCHYLFRERDLRGYVAAEGLPAAWPYVNGVTVSTYREIWAEQTTRFDRLFLDEHPTGGVGAELIAEHPSCFRGKVPSFDDLTVAAIEICLRKR
jgi:2-polyprenyl-6-hydroxyphenyl methylase/3-demethylubiquinone-9 3-methyltransferase